MSFQTNFITENFKIYTLTQPKIKIKTFIHNIYIIYLVRGGRKSDIEGKIDILGKREIRVDGGRRRPNRVGFGVEWSGLVVGGGQIGDVEQQGEGKWRRGALESLVEHGLQSVVKIEAQPKLVDAWLAIREVGLGCLWIGDEGEVA